MADDQFQWLVAEFDFLTGVVADRYHSDRLDREDALGCARLGLVQAARRWPEHCRQRDIDPTDTGRFATYANRRICGAVVDHLRTMGWMSRYTYDSVRALADSGTDQDPERARLARFWASCAPYLADDFDLIDPGLELSEIHHDICAAIRGLDRTSRLVLTVLYVLGLDRADAQVALGMNKNQLRAARSMALTQVLDAAERIAKEY